MGQVALVDAFTHVAGRGNRAGVVVDAGDLDGATMQAMARAVGVSETAFLCSDPRDTECRVRFFTPATEIPFCGHASVALLHLLHESWSQPVPGPRAIVCPAGRFDAELERIAGGARVWLTTPSHPWADSPIDESVVLELLGATPIARDPRLPILRSGPKLFVPLRSRADLFALQPEWERLAAVGRARGILGVFAFTRDAVEPDSVTHGRYFTPAQGVHEDPVTGAAHGPLAEYLVTHDEVPLPRGNGVIRVRAEQGDAMGKPGRLDLEIAARGGELARVRIGGEAVTVLVGDVRLTRRRGLPEGLASLLVGVHV